MQKILIVEDDLNLAMAVSGMLEMNEYQVLHLSHGNAILQELADFQPDIVLLDIILNNGRNGFELAKVIRTHSEVPIIFTTSRQENNDLETGFSFSNVDYIRKPYRVIEVLIRVKNMLQKTPPPKQPGEKLPLQLGGYWFYPDQHTLNLEKNHRKLTRIESALLHLLCQHLNEYVSREEIIQKVWYEDDAKSKDPSLYNTISRLRSYLKEDSRINIESRNALGVRMIISPSR